MKINAICILTGLLLISGTQSSRAASLRSSVSRQGFTPISVDTYSTPVDDEVSEGLVGDLQDDLSLDKTKKKKKKKKKKKVTTHAS